MSTKTIRFFDEVALSPATPLAEIRDSFLSTGQPGSNRPLMVKVAATHAGIITRNHGFYLPDKMQAGTASWTRNYPKPVLAHHEADNDPIGRISQATYVDLSDHIQDSWAGLPLRNATGKQRGQVDKEFLDKLVKGRVPFLQCVDFVLGTLIKDGKLDDPNYQGLGYIELVLSITDEEAQKKILDGRYLTGSVAVSTNHAVCSVCKEDWATGDLCEHRPGKIYDGEKAFVITGDLDYSEYSYVNKPADRHARTIEILTDGEVSDNVDIDEPGDEAALPIRTFEVLLMVDSEKKDAVSIKTQVDKEMVVRAHDGLHYRHDGSISFADHPDMEGKARESYQVSKDDADLHLKLHQEAKAGGFLGALLAGPLDRLLPEKSLWPPVVEVPKEGRMVQDASKEGTMKDKATQDIKDSTATEPELGAYAELDSEVKAAEDAALADKTKVLEAFKSFQDGKLEVSALFETVKGLSFVIGDADIKEIGDSLKDLDGEKFYDALLKAEEKNYKDEEDEGIKDYLEKNPEELKDAKLSTAQRKKMRGSAFCGPNRSFPVNDCAHVTAARRLIGRAKVSTATKARILACVSRKSRAMGCGGGKDSVSAAAETGEGLSVLTFDQVVIWLGSQKEFGDKEQTALNEALGRVGLIMIKAEEVSGLKDKVVELETKLADKACSECKENLDAVSELQKRVSALREELQLAYKDLELLQENHADTVDSLRRSQAGHLADLTLLKGDKDVKERKELVDSFLASDADLGVRLDSLAESVDITRIAANLNSGLAREPSGTVDNPVLGSKANTTVGGEGAPGEVKDKVVFNKETLDVVQEQYLGILLGQRSRWGTGQEGADRFLSFCREQNLVPKGFVPGGDKKTS